MALVTNVPQISNLMSQSANSYAAARGETWANIDKATADLRRKLVAKYKVEF